MSFTKSGHWEQMPESIIYLKALCSRCLPLSISFTPSLSSLMRLCPPVSPPLCVFVDTLHLFFLALLSSSDVSPHLSLLSHRPSSGGLVPCAWPQPEAGGPEGDAERRGGDRSRDWRLPPQWCGHVAESLPGRAARASAHSQTLSCAPQDWRSLSSFVVTSVKFHLKMKESSSSVEEHISGGPCYLLQFSHPLCPELTRFDDKGNKTNVPDKERQIEAFQLLFMLLPPANRSLLKLLLDLLFHTARNQNVNKMSAINLATMFAPHIIWPKNVKTFGLLFSILLFSIVF